MSPTLKRKRDNGDDDMLEATTIVGSPVESPSKKSCLEDPNVIELAKDVGTSPDSNSKRKRDKLETDSLAECPSKRPCLGQHDVVELAEHDETPHNNKLKRKRDKLETDLQSTAEVASVPTAKKPCLMKAPVDFFDLAGELRNSVYEEVFSSGVTATDGKCPQEPSLLSTNKQVRNEAIAYYYESTFSFNSMAVAARFLKGLSEQKSKLLKDVRVLVPSVDRANEHTLRKTSRALVCWQHAYKQKGLAESVVRIQLPVFQDSASRNVDTDLIWASLVACKETEHVGTLQTEQTRMGKFVTVRKTASDTRNST